MQQASGAAATEAMDKAIIGAKERSKAGVAGVIRRQRSEAKSKRSAVEKRT
jgi:hypothetical protein